MWFLGSLQRLVFLGVGHWTVETWNLTPPSGARLLPQTVTLMLAVQSDVATSAFLLLQVVLIRAANLASSAGMNALDAVPRREAGALTPTPLLLSHPQTQHQESEPLEVEPLLSTRLRRYHQFWSQGGFNPMAGGSRAQ